MRNMERYFELLGCWDDILDQLVKEAPVTPSAVTNSLVDEILKKTLYVRKDTPIELVNATEAAIFTSIICRWYKLDADDLGRAIWSKESAEIMNKCESFIAKMREEYDNGN